MKIQYFDDLRLGIFTKKKKKRTCNRETINSTNFPVNSCCCCC